MSVCPGCGKESTELRSLPCSHVLCLSCVEKRGQSGDSSSPICSQTIPKDGFFPPKFSGEFQCDFCSKWKDSEEFWFCEDCVSLTCSFCCIENHKNHVVVIHKWADSSQTVQQILNKLQTLSQGVGDDLGNRGKWRELMLPVIRALAILVKDEAASVQRLINHVQNAYQLLATAQLVSADGEGTQPLAEQEEKLDSNLKVLEQLLNLAKAPDPSLTRRVRGFKSSPEAVAQLIFDQLDFGEEAPAKPEEQENVPLVAGDDEPIEELVEPCQNLESLQPLDNPFHLCMEKEPITFVFGSHWAFVILWKDVVEIWNIRNLGDCGVPVLIARIQSRANQTFKTAAVCDQETIADANSRLYILVQFWTRPWSVLVIDLNTGLEVNNGYLKVFNDNRKTIVNGRIACSPTNAVTMVALNSASNNQQPCKLWELGTDMKLKEFRKNPIPSIESLAVLSLEKGISLVVTKIYSELTAINLYQTSSTGIQLLSKISPVIRFSSFFWFPGVQLSLCVCDERKLNLWEVDAGSNEVKLLESAEMDVKPNAVVGFIGGRFVAANTTSDWTAESNRFHVWVSFFCRENCNGVFVPVSP